MMPTPKAIRNFVDGDTQIRARTCAA
jgi:hypothetical protein